jgi:hypothetical protein
MFVSPQIVSTVRDRILNIATDVLNQNRADLWWRDVAQEEFGQSETEIYTFALQAAKLKDMGVKGQGVAFDSRQYLQNSVTHHYFREGFTLTDGELTDLDSNRIQAAVDWVRDITADGLYNPQRLLAIAILLSTTKAYDGKNFFATDHFTNGKDAVAGSFGNLWVGTGYDISTTVTIDVAVKNFSAARQKVKVLKDPSGKPRNLKVKAVLAPAPLYPRLVQVIQAQYVPGSVAGGSGGGTQDIAMLSSALGFGRPLEAVELGADFSGSTDAGQAYTGNDAAYYFVCEYAGPHAPFVLSNREPFRLFENSMGSSAELARINAWEWIYSGRQNLMPMHPYLIHKFSPT